MPVNSAAGQFYRAALSAFEHAKQHVDADSALDAAQVVLSLDFGCEMLLKAILLHRGESIMIGKQSIDLGTALKRAGSYKNSSSVEVLHQRRNSLQHFAQHCDRITAAETYECILRFVKEVLKEVFGEDLPDHIKGSLIPESMPTISGLERLFPGDLLQRDVSASGDIVTWAQAIPGGSELVVWAKVGVSAAHQLTPEGEFEYMPQTDGVNVVAYRQSGGVVFYGLGKHTREILSETGGPTDIRGPWVVAQGIGISGGLGGGIFLYNQSSKTWSRISETGDTGKLTDENIFWEELEGESLVIKYRGLTSTKISRVISGTHPSPSGELVAWSDWNANPDVHVSKLDGSIVFESKSGTFPNLYDGAVAYLKPIGGTYAVSVYDVRDGRELIEVPNVGFPMGRGPVLSDAGLFFESSANGLNAIWFMPEFAGTDIDITRTHP